MYKRQTVEIGRARQSAQAMSEPASRADFAQFAPEPDLAMIVRRARLKARACEVVLRREQMPEDDPARSAIREEIDGLVTQAQSLPSCFLWASFRAKPLPPLEVIELSARAYENLADSAELAQRTVGSVDLRRFREDAIALMAEAQSALRVILERTWLTKPEQDQHDAFLWLRDVTESERVYVQRFLRIDDPADPLEHARLRGDLVALRVRLDAATDRSKLVGSALGKLRYHAKRAAESLDQGELAALATASDQAAAAGLLPEDRRVGDALAALLPLLEQGLDLSAFVGRALAAHIERSSIGDADSSDRAYSENVDRVRALLRGSRVVLIGGQVIPHQRERLLDAFALADLDWVVQTEHGSSVVFEAPIGRPNTRLVLTLVRFTGHEHIESVRHWCRQYAKPMVMLKAGYNPEQVAAAILEQASEQLS